MGCPSCSNFESAALALPSLVGYLFPLSLAFLVTVGLKLLVAGTGAYVLARLLGCRPAAAAFVGTTFMLSGSFAAWLGWAIGGPLAWSGWVVAGCILAYRNRFGFRGIALLALAVAFAIYGGFPETYVLMAIGLAVLLVVGTAAHALTRRRLSLSGLARAGCGAAFGLALAAPLWLPGIAVVRESIRAGRVASTGIPLHFGLLVFAQGYDGLPLQTPATPSGTWIGTSFNYNETAAYVGVVALVLALAALVAWRRAAVLALTTTVVVSALVVYNLGHHAPVQRLITHLGLEGVALQRMLIVLGFALAMLAGLGLELSLRRWREPAVQAALGIAVLVVAAVLALMWAKSASAAVIPEATPAYPHATPLSASSVRHDSLLWPTVETAVMALAVAGIVVASRRRRRAQRDGEDAARWDGEDAAGMLAGVGREGQRSWRRPEALAAGTVLAVQSAFLIFAGVGLNSYAAAMYPTDRAVTTLQHLVGPRLLGLDGPNATCPAGTTASCGVRQWTGIGLYPEMNLPYGVDELAVHDPLTPKAYFDSWPVAGAGQDAGGLNVFAPAVDTLSLARRYGVQDLLVQKGTPVPAGTRPLATIEGPTKAPVELVTVPGSARFSFLGGRARVLASSHPGDASYDVRVEVPPGAPQQLVLRITDAPGWHVSAGGRALPVTAVDGTFLSVRVPSGTTTIVAVYRPALLEVGLDLALAALVALIALVALELGAPATLGRLVVARRAPVVRADGDARRGQDAPVVAEPSAGLRVPTDADGPAEANGTAET